MNEFKYWLESFCDTKTWNVVWQKSHQGKCHSETFHSIVVCVDAFWMLSGRLLKTLGWSDVLHCSSLWTTGGELRRGLTEERCTFHPDEGFQMSEVWSVQVWPFSPADCPYLPLRAVGIKAQEVNSQFSPVPECVVRFKMKFVDIDYLSIPSSINPPSVHSSIHPFYEFAESLQGNRALPDLCCEGLFCIQHQQQSEPSFIYVWWRHYQILWKHFDQNAL